MFEGPATARSPLYVYVHVYAHVHVHVYVYVYVYLYASNVRSIVGVLGVWGKVFERTTHPHKRLNSFKAVYL